MISYGRFSTSVSTYKGEQRDAERNTCLRSEGAEQGLSSNEYAREIAFNVIGNIIADNLSDDVVENVKSQFGMK